LVDKFTEYKDEENATRQKRVAIEEQIAALVPGPESGQTTVTLEDGTKITVKRGLNYKADLDEIRRVCDELHLEHIPIQSKTTHTLDERGYEYYLQDDPVIAQALSRHVTATPKKTSVTIR